MTLRRLKSFLCTLCVLLSISDHVTGHVQMSNPMPLRSPLDTQDMGGVKDYDMTSPLRADGSNFPCKGYHLDSPLRTTARYQAGSTYTAQFLGGATHDGGSCQLSLSYDGGKTFKVIKSVVGGCPLAGSYPFTVPSYAPAGIALFAWTWMNKVGNREFYMDCAAVQIVGQNSAGRRLAKRAQSMDDLPNIWVANLRGINTCSTFEGLNPVFPHPGDDVVYGDGMSSASPATDGQCEVPAPGSTIQQSDPFAPEGTIEPEQTTITYQETYTVIPEPSYTAIEVPVPVASLSAYVQGALETIGAMEHRTPSIEPSTTYTEEDYEPTGLQQLRIAAVPITTSSASGCIPVVTVTVTLTRSTSQCAPTVTVDLGASSTRSSSSKSTSRSETSSSWLTPSWTSSTTPASASQCVTTMTLWPPTSISHPSSWTSTSSIPTPSPSIPVTNIPYATPPLEAYLPCVPGTFLCLSLTTFLTCIPTPLQPPIANTSIPSTYAWTYSLPPTVVADGMMCLPYISYNGTASGGFRDDRYVRSRPVGDCGSTNAVVTGEGNGDVECLRDGSGFMVCDWGGWIDMGDVAQGTVCVDGIIQAIGESEG